MSEAQSVEHAGTRRRKPTRRGWIIAGSVVGALVLAIVLFLAFFDWDYARGPVSRFASHQIGRQVRIDGHLRVKLLSWSPSATVEGLKIANPAGTPGNFVDIKKVAVSVKLMRLLRGQVVMPYLVADEPNVVLLRDAKGANNWTLKGKSPGEPTRLPAIRRFEINNGKLRMDDKQRRLTLNATVSSSEVVGAKRVEGFRLRGDGSINSEPFKLNLTGGPLLNVDPNRPYPFDADVRAGGTTILAKGSITKPFDLGRFSTALTVRGPDLSDLYELTGIALPNTPPYAVSGQLTRRDRRFDYTGINGKVGDSDLHGQLGVQTGGRIMLTGDLQSRVLDFDDLNAIMGGAPSTGGGETASAKQIAVAQTMNASRRLLPDAKLQVERLRGMDANVKYRATTIRSENFPVRRGSVNLKLDKGLLTLEQLNFGLSNGEIAGRVAINARQNTPVVDLDVRMTGARVEQFLPARFAGNAVNGSLVGRAKLTGHGGSVRQAAATANGTVTVVMPHGEIRKAFAELMGVNVTKGLGLLLTKNQEKTDIRCGVAEFQARNGVLSADRFVVDTGPVIARGSGNIDLRDETLNLKVKGEPKEFRLVRLVLPITLDGPLLSPKLGVDTGKVVGQVGLAAAVGTVLAPLAAVLPFVDGGLAKDANCTALLNGAPTAVAAPTVAETKAAKKG